MLTLGHPKPSTKVPPSSLFYEVAYEHEPDRRDSWTQIEIGSLYPMDLFYAFMGIDEHREIFSTLSRFGLMNESDWQPASEYGCRKKKFQRKLRLQVQQVYRDLEYLSENDDGPPRLLKNEFVAQLRCAKLDL